MSVFTVLFNKCALKGEVFEASKHAKIVCLSKDGLYPEETKLRPISLLPNIGKWYERCIHEQLISWCTEKNIFIDEQSGFTSNRRLQTRILTLCEDLRLTVAACNRPALVIFIDFLSAFDRVWYPALIANLLELEMPLPLVRWVYKWLQGRTMSIHYGESISKMVRIFSGTPQGSLLSATLFRLHIHSLPKVFARFCSHLFADDVAVVIKGQIEKRLSDNIDDLEKQAKIAMSLLEKYSKNLLLPVNVRKTKAMLVHSTVSPTNPKVFFENKMIETVSSFKYLGVEIRTKMGWGPYIRGRVMKIRNIYTALRRMFRTIPSERYKIRNKLFCAFAFLHFVWLFVTWFYFTETQRQEIEHIYCTGLRLIYDLREWNDFATLVLARERSILDYVYDYWDKFMKHLNESSEGNEYRQTWDAYLNHIVADKRIYNSMGLRKNNFYINRYVQRVHHTNLDVSSFFCEHQHQKDYLKSMVFNIKSFIYKYIETSSFISVK